MIPQITSPEAMCDAIRAAGIIPFFKGPVPGFSIEELTPPEHWFASSDELGPWDWKIAAVQSGDIAYGKFLFGGKAAFATVEWFAHLHNWRLSLPECAPDSAGGRVLELAAEQGSVSSADIRRLLGLKKAAADGVSSRLMHQTADRLSNTPAGSIAASAPPRRSSRPMSHLPGSSSPTLSRLLRLRCCSVASLPSARKIRWR